MSYSFEDLAREFPAARAVAVLTGAGISAEGGVPTFRGKDGIWDKIAIEEVATIEAFRRDPVRVWEWFLDMKRTVKECRPNAAHHILARMEEHFEDFTLITQNIDNYHKEAGSRNIVELHGNAWRSACTACGRRIDDNRLEFDELPPRCYCGSRLKPDVVFFGESLPVEAIEKAFEAVRRCDFMLVIGTSAIVQPAASLPFYAHQAKARILEINLEPTYHTPMASLSLFEAASSALEKIEKILG